MAGPWCIRRPWALAGVFETSTQGDITKLSDILMTYSHLLGWFLPSWTVQLLCHWMSMAIPDPIWILTLPGKRKQHVRISGVFLLDWDHYPRGRSTTIVMFLVICQHHISIRLAPSCKCQWPDASIPTNHHETICQSTQGRRMLFMWSTHQGGIQLSVRCTKSTAWSH